MHVIDIAPIDETDPVESAKVILNELATYDQQLLDKPRWLVLNKIDMVPDLAEREEKIKNILERLNWQGKVFKISALCREGTELLCYELMNLIDELKQAE